MTELTIRELDKLVLDALIELSDPEANKGITIYDFDEKLGITEAILAESIQRLEYGIFETENDAQIEFKN